MIKTKPSAVLAFALAIMLLLASCQQTVADPDPQEPEAEYTYPVEELDPETPTEAEEVEPETPPTPTREDYIEMLYALQHAFATGEFEAFVEAFPGLAEEGRGMPGPAVNEWPALLEGVTAEMFFDAEDVLSDPEWPDRWAHLVTVQLYVSGGNVHLPDGRQTLELSLIPNRDTDNTPSIICMMRTTDGQQWYLFSGLPENPTIEDKTLSVTAWMVGTWAELPIDRIMIFIRIFENEDGWGYSHTEEEMIAGAKKYLGIEDFSPIYSHRDGTAPEGERSHRVRLTDDGRYEIPGHGFQPSPFNLVILDTPSQGDLTVRVFFFANEFMLELSRITDFNFLILYNDDGTPYARLLSEQAVPEI